MNSKSAISLEFPRARPGKVGKRVWGPDPSNSPLRMYVQGPSRNIRCSLAWTGLGRPRRIWKSLCLGSHVYAVLWSSTREPRMHSGEYVVPSTHPVGENWRFTCKIRKLGPCCTHTYTKVNSKCIKDTTVRSETFKLMEEHAGEGLFGARLGNGFSGGTPKPRAAKAKTDKDGGLQ